MRRVYKSSGFWLSFAVNLIFRLEWLGFAVIALVLHIAFGLTLIVMWIFLGAWVVISLLITLLLGWVTKDTPPDPYKENKNPYSEKNRNPYSSDGKNDK